MKKARKTKNKAKQITNNWVILIRYLILLFLVLLLPVIYEILAPLTIYAVAGLLKISSYNILIRQDFLIINSKTIIQLIPACIAGSAYLLLLILNLSTPMALKKRLYSILFSIALLFLANVLRIALLSIYYQNQLPFFDFTHKFFWYFLSTLFVIIIWFLSVKTFNIKEIPIYSDLKLLIKEIR